MTASLLHVEPGSFVQVRERQWIVETSDLDDEMLNTVRLSCISDDAQGEPLEVLWDAEINARLLDGDVWSCLANGGTDDTAVFAAFLRTLKWNTATAADRDLFQAPFRAGIRLDSYQLLPLRKALRLSIRKATTEKIKLSVVRIHVSVIVRST
jgi:hypothetical protein